MASSGEMVTIYLQVKSGLVVLCLGGVGKQRKTFMNFSKERSLLITIKWAIWTILLLSNKTLFKPLGPTRHLFFVQLQTPYFLLPHRLHSYDLLHPLQVYEPLLKILYTTDKLFVEELILIFQQVGNFERFLLAKAKPNSKFMPIMVVSIQNLLWNLSEIIYCFELLGC